MDMHDIQLVQSTKMRNTALIQENEVFTLKPDGSLKKCQCGEVYCEEELAGVAMLYTSIGAIQYAVIDYARWNFMKLQLKRVFPFQPKSQQQEMKLVGILSVWL